MTEVIVNGVSHTIGTQALRGSKYFARLLNDTGTINLGCVSNFKEIVFVLKFLQDRTTPVANKYLSVLTKFEVTYLPSDVMYVNVNVRGKMFKVRPLVLSECSTFRRRLTSMYVGQDLHVNSDKDTFTHIINRLYDRSYRIPKEYIHLKKELGLPDLDLDSINRLDCCCTYWTGSHVKVLLKSKAIRRHLTETECTLLPRQTYSDSYSVLFDYLTDGIVPDIRHKSFFEWAKIIPKKYHVPKGISISGDAVFFGIIVLIAIVMYLLLR